MSTLFSDSFTRADSALTLGAPWVVRGAPSGTWGVASNRAYSVQADADGLRIAVVDVAAADVQITATVAVIGASGNGTLILRYQDGDNFWYLALDQNANTFGLWEVESATPELYGTPVPYTPQAGDILQADCIGISITGRVLRGGVTIAQTGTTGADTFVTATKFGLGANSGTERFDDFLVTDPVESHALRGTVTSSPYLTGTVTTQPGYP